MAEIPAALAPNPITPEATASAAPAQTAVPYGNAEQAILSGKYEVPAGKTVTVVNHRGEAFDLPSDRLRDAIEEGYKIETPEQGAIRQHVRENSGVMGDIKVGALQAANQLLLDVPQTVFEHTANPFEVKKWQALKDSHEIANAMGGVGGFAGSLLVAAPLFKAASAAGGIAERALAEKLAASGIERGSKSIAKDLLARTVTNAAKLGTEGIVISAPRAVTEAALGDPNAAAESLLMGGGLGVALGVVAGPTGKLFEKLNLFQTKAEQAASAGSQFTEAAPSDSSFKNSMGERTMPNTTVESTGDLVQDARNMGADEELVSRVEKGTKNLKTNANEIQSSAEALGLPVLPEQISSDKAVHDMAGALASRTDTIPGAQRAKMYQDRFDAYDKAAKEILNFGSEETSQAIVGHRIKQDLLDEAQKAIKPVSDFFNVLGESYEAIPVSPKGLNQIAKNIEDLQQVRTSVGPAKGLGKNVAEALRSGDIKSLSDLKAFRTSLHGNLSLTASPAERSLMGEISDKLLSHEESSIDRYAEGILKRTGNAGQATVEKMDELAQLYPKMKQARGQWRELITNFSDDLDAMGGRPIKSPYDFINQVEALSPEQVAKRFAPKNDSESLKRLMERYPDKVEGVLNFEKAKILEKSLKDGVINPRTFVAEVKKLTPEFRNALFGEDSMRVVNAIKTDIESLPAKINPSGTAKTLGWYDAIMGEGLSHAPGQVMKNVHAAADAAKIRASVSVEGVLGAEKSLLAARGKLEKLGDIINNLKSGSAKSVQKIKDIGPERPMSTILRLVGEDDKGSKQEAFKKLQDKMNQVSANPGGFAQLVADKTAGLAHGGAPNVATAYQTKLVNSLTYIQNAMPKRRTIANPIYSPPYKPSDAELSAFEKKLAVVEDPSVVLKALQSGTLTKDHVEALAVNYPLFYQALKSRILDHVTEHGTDMNYQSRLKLSLLLGFGVDPSTDPANVARFQQSFLPVQNQQGSPVLKAGGLERLKPSETYATPSQRALARDQK